MPDYDSAPPPEKQTGLIILMCAGVVALCVVVAGVAQLKILSISIVLS